MSSPDLPKQGQSYGTLEKHLKSSSVDAHMSHQLASLSSFGHALFKSVKSTQSLHFLFFFFTTTMLASQSGKNTSLMAPVYFNFSTSSFTAVA